MDKIIQLLLAFVCVIFSVCVKAENTTQTASPNEGMIKQTVKAFMESNNIPGAAVLLYENGVSHAYYFGYANRDSREPVTKNTIFELGSVSKIMTNLLLAQQVDYAKMQFNAPISTYLNNLPTELGKVSLQDLATHISGLPFGVPENVQTREELEKFLNDKKPFARNREIWRYSNIGIGLIGYALEVVTEKDFEKLYRTRILNPLGMQAVGLTVPKQLQKFYAQGYSKAGQPVPPVNLSLFPAAASLKARAHDMQNFLRAAIGLPGTPIRIFYPMRLTQVGYVKLPNKIQGLGWSIHEITWYNTYSLLHAQTRMDIGPTRVAEIVFRPTFDGNKLLDKTGGTQGFRAYIAVIPNKRSGIVILTNKFVDNAEIVNTGRRILFKVAKV